MDLEKFKYRPNSGQSQGRDRPVKAAARASRPLSGPTIPPILAPNLRIVFIGFNPGTKSGQTGHHYAHHSNRFWKLLHASGLTKERLSAAEDRSLLNIGYGFTDLVARTTKSASVLTGHEKLEGAAKLDLRLRGLGAELLCFVGKGVWDVCARYKGFKQPKFEYGLQSETYANSQVFVVPSTSGLVSIGWDVQLELWKKLQELVGSDGHDQDAASPSAASCLQGG